MLWLLGVYLTGPASRHCIADHLSPPSVTSGKQRRDHDHDHDHGRRRTYAPRAMCRLWRSLRRMSFMNAPPVVPIFSPSLLSNSHSEAFF